MKIGARKGLLLLAFSGFVIGSAVVINCIDLICYAIRNIELYEKGEVYMGLP